MSSDPGSLAPAGRDASVRDRGDACPGSLRLHSADDGALARIRVPGGILTVRQARTLADLARRLGDGELHLTSRGNVQVRGLAEGCGAELADRLSTSDLLPSPQHDRARNIVASPLSGLDGRGRGDVRAWVRELDRLVCASAPATRLSGRFLFAVDDGRGDVAALDPDVTLVATDAGAALLRLGSSPAAIAVPPDAAPLAALLAAEVFLAAASASATRVWRWHEVPDPAPLAAEVRRRLLARGVDAHVATAVAADLPEVPEPAGSTGSNGSTGPAPGIVPAPDGTATLSVLAPLGRLSASRWLRLASLAADDGAGEVRLTPWRGVLVPGLSTATARERMAELSGPSGRLDDALVTTPESPWTGVGACIGRPGCARSLADVRSDVAATLGAGGSSGASDSSGADGTRVIGGGLPVYWSGCERRCGHPRGEWVDVVATGAGYDVTVHGERLGTALVGPADLAATVAAARTAVRPDVSTRTPR
ncbi:precorrin-3B synthase [Actinopolymorpha pittospori]